MRKREPLHMKQTPTAYRIFRAFMIGTTAALLLIASALALWQAKTTKRRPGRKAVVY